ncbi:MAG: hypothetical protein JJE17_09525 [Peptostreptococcaceae bacterium]|nr:hypothetical protein [Peptostreptococcaceae bacterium]
MLIVNKPKMAIYTLIAVLLIAGLAVGCTFTGAKEEQENFLPDTVSMVQPLSSAFSPDPITNTKTVEYLWSVYQEFEFDGTEETLDNIWSISVTFSNSESGESENFTIFKGGICWLGEDYETNHILLDGADIYNEFLSYFEAAKKTEPISQSGVKVSVDDLSDVPDAVIGYAKDCVVQQIDNYHEGWSEFAPGCSVTAAKITGLTQMNTGTVGLNTGVNLYLLEYRLRLDGNVDAVLVGGMNAVDIDGEDWLTEWSSTGQPYLLLHYDDSGDNPIWQCVCVTNTDVINADYGTPEMLERYGNAYTATAMELYYDYLEQTKAPVSADYTTDELLNQYASFDEFVQIQDEYSQRILIMVSTPVSDFKFSRINFDESNGGVNYIEDEVLYSQNELNPEKPLVVWVSFPGTLPQRGISFVDESGKERRFVINMSGEDGAILLSEY